MGLMRGVGYFLGERREGIGPRSAIAGDIAQCTVEWQFFGDEDREMEGEWCLEGAGRWSKICLKLGIRRTLEWSCCFISCALWRI